MAQSMRVAMAKDSGYESFMGELRQSLNALEYGRENTIEESWQSLKDMRKG